MSARVSRCQSEGHLKGICLLVGRRGFRRRCQDKLFSEVGSRTQEEDTPPDVTMDRDEREEDYLKEAVG